MSHDFNSADISPNSLTGLLTCRFMLDLREAAAVSGGDGCTISIKTIMFQTSISWAHEPPDSNDSSTTIHLETDGDIGTC